MHMRNFLKWPYALFLYSGITSALFSFMSGDKIIHIRIHDTYLDVSNSRLLLFMAIVFFFYWIVYILFQQSLLSNILVWMHFIMTFISLLAIVFANKSVEVENSSPSYIDLSRNNMMTSIIFIGLLFSVVLFVINIIGGAIRKLSSH